MSDTLLERHRAIADSDVLARWERLLGLVTLHKAWPHKPERSIRLAENRTVEVKTTIVVTDTDTGLPSVVTHVDVIPDDVPSEHAVAFLVNQLRDVLNHEIDECLLVGGKRWLVGGKRWRNPHVRTGHPCPVHKGCQITAVNRGEQTFKCTGWPEAMPIP